MTSLLRRTPDNLCAILLFLLITPAHANNLYTWDGGGSTNDWSDAFNWLGNVAPPSSIDTELIFSGNTRLAPLQNSNFTLNTLDFDANAGAFLLGGTGTLTFKIDSDSFGPSIVQASAANQTINNKIAVPDSIGIYTMGAGTLTLNGVISGAGGITKQGAGSLTLTAKNTYSGVTSIAAGTLRLDFSAASGAAATNIVAGASAMTMNGSTLAIQGSNVASTNTSQTFSGLTIFAGAQTIALTAGTGGTTTLNLGSITRNVGGTMNFLPTTNTFISTSATNANNILGGYAVYGGNDWAMVSSGQIARYTAYTNNTWTPGNNTTVTASANVASDSTTNSLRFGTAAALTLTLAGTNTITSGGLLVSSAVGNNLTQINGGSLTGASSADLIVYQNNTAAGLTIGSAIVNNGGPTSLTKSGPGLLTLTGASTFTGLLRVYEGTLTFAAGSSWNNPSPTGILQAAVVRGGATLNINGTINITNQELDISTTVSAPAIVNLNAGGTLTAAATAIGYAGTGIFNQTGGTHNTDFLRMSAAYSGSSIPVSNSTYNLSGGALNTRGAIIGDQAVATFNHTAGTVAVVNGIELSAGSSYNLSGATSTVTATNMRLGGYTGGGTFNQSNGTLTITGDPADFIGYLSVGDASNGTYNLSGGALATSETDLGYLGNGIFNHTGGTHTINNAGTLYMGYESGSTGLYNLSGGTLQLGNVIGLNGVSTFNFNGGTLKASADNASFVGGLTSANVQAGGARIDSNGHAVTIDQPLLHDASLGATADGGLTKQGAGALTLTGASTYTGPTAVNGGTLFVNGILGSEATATGTVTVANNGSILAGNGMIHGSVSVSGAISPGASGSGSTATLGVGSLTLARNSIFSIDLNSTVPGIGYDQVSVTGTVTNAGAQLLLNPGPGLQIGDTFFILLNDGTDPLSGKFAGLQTEGQTFESGGDFFQISYFANGDGGALGNDISLTVVPVPEPGTWASGLLALMAIGYGLRSRSLATFSSPAKGTRLRPMAPE